MRPSPTTDPQTGTSRSSTGDTSAVCVHTQVVLAAGLALIRPSLFTWISTTWITWGLAVTMLGMGLTMKVGVNSCDD